MLIHCILLSYSTRLCFLGIISANNLRFCSVSAISILYPSSSQIISSSNVGFSATSSISRHLIDYYIFCFLKCQ